MKNRIISCGLMLLSFVLLFTGCESGASERIDHYYDEDGYFVIESEGRRTVMPDELPYNIQYNGMAIPITDVSFYQNKSTSSHNLFIIVRMDVSDLSGSEIHTLQDEALTVNAYITNEANECEFESAPKLGSLLLSDTKELIYVNTSLFSKEHPHGFGNSEITVCVTAKQEDTYDSESSTGKILKINKEECISYSTTTDKTVKNAELIEHPLYDYIAKWLYSEAATIGDLYRGIFD